jgi:DNA (cytosine-5)-methyltransferase 1
MTSLSSPLAGWRDGRPLAAEFFAGIGLVRSALETAGFEVAWANDIEPAKKRLYAANHDASDFVLRDVREISGGDLPSVAVATASFPCTDLSLAGNRAGLAGTESSMLWEFTRVLEEMEERAPLAVLLENVPSFASSHGGEDLRAAIERLNELGYVCDLFVLDARRFVPQSRPRLFIVGSQNPLDKGTWDPSPMRPAWVEQFVSQHPELEMQPAALTAPPLLHTELRDLVERLAPGDSRWWEPGRVARFVESLSPVQSARLTDLQFRNEAVWATAYRRTRKGKAVWEIRPDSISGCLRTARGGSSKQALVEAGCGAVRVRWMTPREYARLQGVPTYDLADASDNQALFGFGDAVCVPAITWVATHYLWPLMVSAALMSAAHSDRATHG